MFRRFKVQVSCWLYLRFLSETRLPSGRFLTFIIHTQPIVTIFGAMYCYFPKLRISRVGCFGNCHRLSDVLLLTTSSYNYNMRYFCNRKQHISLINYDFYFVCCFEQFLEAAPHKTATVRPLIPYLTNHPNKLSKTCWTLLVKWRQTLKRRSIMDSYTWTHQCWSTSKNLHSSVLFGHYMRSWGLFTSDGH